MPAASDVQESGCDWDDIADDTWAKCLQDTPAAAADDQKVVIEFSAFEACLRALLSSGDDGQQEATVIRGSPHRESRHRVHSSVAVPAVEDGVHSDCAQAVDEVCI
ncbi:MAG: hypothetical protein WC681_14845 [Sterolibacterium sp.]|jgi:hypothetical protein